MSGHKSRIERLIEENRAKILDAFIKHEDVLYFAKLVPNADILENGCNIAVSSYVEGEAKTEKVDIKKLNIEIAGIVARQNQLRTAIDEIVADIEGN